MCKNCKGKPKLTFENGYHFSEEPDCLKHATELEKSLCSINIATVRVYMSMQTGVRKFKWHSICYENDIDDIAANYLPRQTNTAQVLVIKNPSVTSKLPELRINLNRIKDILKFYIRTNRYYRAFAENNGTFGFANMNDDSVDGDFKNK